MQSDYGIKLDRMDDFLVWGEPRPLQFGQLRFYTTEIGYFGAKFELYGSNVYPDAKWQRVATTLELKAGDPGPSS